MEEVSSIFKVKPTLTCWWVYNMYIIKMSTECATLHSQLSMSDSSIIGEVGCWGVGVRSSMCSVYGIWIPLLQPPSTHPNNRPTIKLRDGFLSNFAILFSLLLSGFINYKPSVLLRLLKSYKMRNLSKFTCTVRTVSYFEQLLVRSKCFHAGLAFHHQGPKFINAFKPGWLRLRSRVKFGLNIFYFQGKWIRQG